MTSEGRKRQPTRPETPQADPERRGSFPAAAKNHLTGAAKVRFFEVSERMFCRFKDWRRIATRFDRNIQNFMAAVALAAAVIWWL